MTASVSSLDELPAGLLSEGEGRRLHLGGKQKKAGWEILNAQEADYVDHVGDIRDLTRFEDGSFVTVYASHVFEHLSYSNDLQSAITGVARVLLPEGRFFVSVPDLMTLSTLFSRQTTSDAARFAIMRMMFGGQLDPYDFHYVGLWDSFLAACLHKAKFREVYRVPTFGMFDDASNVSVHDELISLNMVAIK